MGFCGVCFANRNSDEYLGRTRNECQWFSYLSYHHDHHHLSLRHWPIEKQQDRSDKNHGHLFCFQSSRACNHLRFFGVWWLQFPWTWRTAGVTPSCGNACASKWWQPQNHPKSRFLMNEGTKQSVTFEYLAQNEWDGKIGWLKTKQQTGIWDLSQPETGW